MSEGNGTLTKLRLGSREFVVKSRSTLRSLNFVLDLDSITTHASTIFPIFKRNLFNFVNAIG